MGKLSSTSVHSTLKCQKLTSNDIIAGNARERFMMAILFIENIFFKYSLISPLDNLIFSEQNNKNKSGII